ncbi:MAG: YdcH family protein [Beijerinckiaceae bacterium]
MSHVPHELSEEFPEAAERIHALKLGNAHFAKLADRYHEVNRTIHRMETNVEPAADETMEEMKKQRLALKDEIAAMLAS